MTKIGTIIAALPTLSDDERVALIKALAEPLSWSYGHDEICKGLDMISQDIADNDAAANRHWAGLP